MSDGQTEKATPRRKKKAREQGDIVRSRELLSAVAMLGGLLMLRVAAETFVKAWRDGYARCLALAVLESAGDWSTRDLRVLLRVGLLPIVWPVTAVLLASAMAAGSVGFAQSGGFTFNAGAISPKLERLNPGSHVKQLFSLRALLRVAKSLLPAAAIAAMGWSSLRAMMTALPVLSLQRLPGSLDGAYALGVKAAWVLVVWSGVDYAVEWRAWNQRLRMSKQEMREEMKEAMGNPQIKGKLRQMQRAMARRKARADMSRASVVITNPTHYAVALEFSFETMGAPMVLTKGRDLQALDIREEAQRAGVPIVENPPLARSLYRSVEVGRAIPFELYAAVAGILAFLFRQRQEEQSREQRRHEERRQEALQQAATPARHGFSGGM